MTEANKFLDRKGYDEVKLHEMVVIPKIQMQSIMQEFADEQFEEKHKVISDSNIALASVSESVDLTRREGFIQGAKWYRNEQQIK